MGGHELREAKPMTPHPTAVQVEFYRGYRINVFGEGSAWSVKLSRTRFDVPSIGPRSIFFKIANTECRALSLAKIEIDWLLAQKRRLKEQADTTFSSGLA
jgi:hypothetical protein